MPSTELEKPQDNNIIVSENHPIEEWDDLDMDSSVLRGIYAYGFESPSPIQKRESSQCLINAM